MADYKKLIPFILRWEGGFANDPADRGGATMKGITIGTFTTYRKSKGKPTPTVTDLKNISDQEWGDVFKSLFWDKWCADNIKSQSVANILVDWVWASGKYGITIPQRILGVAQDGVVGPKTLEALNARDADKLFAQLKQARINFVETIVKRNPSQKKFINGWKRRIYAIQ